MKDVLSKKGWKNIVRVAQKQCRYIVDCCQRIVLRVEGIGNETETDCMQGALQRAGVRDGFLGEYRRYDMGAARPARTARTASRGVAEGNRRCGIGRGYPYQQNLRKRRRKRRRG